MSTAAARHAGLVDAQRPLEQLALAVREPDEPVPRQPRATEDRGPVSGQPGNFCRNVSPHVFRDTRIRVVKSVQTLPNCLLSGQPVSGPTKPLAVPKTFYSATGDATFTSTLLSFHWRSRDIEAPQQSCERQGEVSRTVQNVLGRPSFFMFFQCLLTLGTLPETRWNAPKDCSTSARAQ